MLISPANLSSYLVCLAKLLLQILHLTFDSFLVDALKLGQLVQSDLAKPPSLHSGVFLPGISMFIECT